MHFVTGGRRTQSGLYRVRWTGAPGIARHEPSPSSPGNPRLVRGDLWQRLDDADPWSRYAARVELEAQPTQDWSGRALQERRPTAALTCLLALSRAGERSLQPQIVERLVSLSSATLTTEQQLIAIRAVAVCFLRMGPPDAQTARAFAATWESRYPSSDARVNQSLCELLVYL
jgi:hypothetical protein